MGKISKKGTRINEKMWDGDYVGVFFQFLDLKLTLINHDTDRMKKKCN
ncbi:hypothetical protein CAEBREN_02857 [Caenorhabditis brenneri]|uniref:Uncharacterized protein n=1 Tax=Caenorhabditis brenneri TaxID=135651 RepID=G0MID9_CAEBE|nr:hypothetical protein CAEBREN_02857 [Caenorhabditis brenneri]